VLVFTRTKHGANRLAEYLTRTASGHGHPRQQEPGRAHPALADFKSGKLQVLVATDIAARGIDIDQCRTWSTSSCPTCPKTTCTASAAPAAPARNRHNGGMNTPAIPAQPDMELSAAAEGRYLLYQGRDMINTCLRSGKPWEPFTQAIARLLVERTPNALVVDVGANLGAFAVPLARHIKGRGGRLHAFEAQRMVYYQLCANLLLNGLDNAHAHHLAIGNHAGQIDVPVLDLGQERNIGSLSLDPEIRRMQGTLSTLSKRQRVVKVRRDYNSWVASETMEDYALRFTPRSFRKWSELRVANTAFGAASFLVLEAVGATLLVQLRLRQRLLGDPGHRADHLPGRPADQRLRRRHGLDMDLLTRGAGFGYIGSTITSLIYASFTFIFFALEAAIMAYALELAFDIPPAWGYLICALVVIPLVTHGVTVISRCRCGPSRCGWRCWCCPTPSCWSRTRRPCRPAALRRRAGRLCRRLRPAVRRRADRGHRADHADGRAGRLPALHAREDGRQTARAGGPACCWAGPAGWCPAC
jgi:FkbM family methyltransferase